MRRGNDASRSFICDADHIPRDTLALAHSVRQRGLDPADEPMRKRPPGAASEETTGSYALLVTPTRTKRLLNASSGHSPGALGDRLLLLTINPARMGYGLMLGLDTVESVAHVIQVALTPVFLLSGIASLLGVLSTRLARVADRVDALAEQLEADGPVDRRKLQRRLAYLRRRSHVLDAAVMMGTLGGVATSCAALLLFVGTLRDRPGVSLFVAFGLALLFTMGALVAFLIEMLLASRGLRDQANYANEVGEIHELAAEGVGEPNSWRVGLSVSTREEMSAFLTGSFVLASRVCARTIEPRIRTSRLRRW